MSSSAQMPARGRRLAIGTVAVSLASALLTGALATAGPAAADTARRQGEPGTAADQANHEKVVSWGDKAWGDKTSDINATTSGMNDATKDAGSLATVTDTIGARALWDTRDANGRAITGQGVTVALLDTGIDTSVAGLDGAGKVINGPDLSFEANTPALAGGDNYGHGTHLAGIIAARDAVTTDPKSGEPKPSSSTQQLGVAPDAKILAVKLGTTDGSTDVSQVIAGLDWVVQHRKDNGMDIRVINLSYGTESTQSYRIDPLAAAVENAWQHNIVVVVSGGNDGSTATNLTNPAIDPYVISVGASDPKGHLSGWNTPAVASFSSRGTPTRHVDLLAPGTSIASLRAPGSFVDVTFPQGLVTGDTTGRLFRGSGTSQAAAVVSGSVALLLQAYPDLTPDQVKYVLLTSANPLPLTLPIDAGAGELDLTRALTLVKTGFQHALPFFTLSQQSFPTSTGLGSLEAARGGSNLIDPDTGTVLTGEIDVQGQAWVPATWRAASVAGTSWTDGTWNGARWSGDSWSSTGWSNAAWSGARWSGASWADAGWSGARWSGARWTGASWRGASWR